MILIFEGPDGSGKSTLAKKLAEQSGWEYRAFSYPRNEHEKRTMFEMYSEVIYSNTGNLIMDRSWYSEMVYGPLMRGDDTISYGQMMELEQMIHKQGGGVIIHCDATAGVLFERLNNRGEDYIDVSMPTIESIKYAYEALFHENEHILPVVRYEYAKKMLNV